MTFKDYIFRSSFTGNIISVPKPLTSNQNETLEAYRLKEKLTERQKADWHSLENKLNESKQFKLTEGAKKLLNQIVFYEKHGRITSLENDYLEKGNRVEKDARDLMTKVLGIPLVKDDERRTNKWVTGKRDINTKNIVLDIKSKWDFNTFNSALVDSSNEIYLRQGDNYMELWEVKDFLLCHVLVDTPFDIIIKQLHKLHWNNVILDLGHTNFIDGQISNPDSIELVIREINNHIYTREGLESFCDEHQSIKIEWFDDFKEIPESQRIHMIAHSFDKIRIEQRNECIKLAREYMDTVNPVNNLKKI
ncbi:MAG: hypothetical protein ACOVSR_08865 [Bacteroidia bacterium]